MSEKPDQPTLLEELDARQNDVLQELEQLNARIEALIQEFAQKKNPRTATSKAA